MGAPSQVIVFNPFGSVYIEQFQVCLQTIPKHWDVVVITDEVFDPGDHSLKIIKVPLPARPVDRLAFRMNIHDFVDINQYDQVWYSDIDVLFKGDILAKYAESQTIMVANEPFTKLDNYHMGSALTGQEVQMNINAPAINGGLWCIPKTEFAFFEHYRQQLITFISLYPDQWSADQLILNAIFHRKEGNFRLFDFGDVGFPTRGFEGKLVNHFIGQFGDKTNQMRNFLSKQ